MSAIEHIVFDVGRVLIQWDPHQVYLDLIADEVERNAFLDICAPWNAEQDRGVRSWHDAEQKLIKTHPDKEAWILAYRRDWAKSIPYAHDGTVEIMRNLISTGHDVTLLTNFNDETWPVALKKYPFLKEPRGATVSAAVKMIKPEAGIYRHHTETFGLQPEKVLFFDDSLKNINAAQTAGWNAELFEGSEGKDALLRLLARYEI